MRLGTDRLSAIVFWALGFVLFWANEKIDAPAFDLLGSKFFPRIASLAMMALSILLFFRGERTFLGKGELAKTNRRSAVFFIILTLAYFLALEFNLGFRASTMIYLALFIFMLGECRLKSFPISFGMAFISTYVLYYFFEKFLQLLLP